MFNSSTNNIVDELFELSNLPNIRNDQIVISNIANEMLKNLTGGKFEKYTENVFFAEEGIELMKNAPKDVMITAKILSTGYPNIYKPSMIDFLNGYIEEMYSGHNVVKAYNGEQEALVEFDKINDKLYKAKRDVLRERGLYDLKFEKRMRMFKKLEKDKSCTKIQKLLQQKEQANAKYWKLWHIIFEIEYMLKQHNEQQIQMHINEKQM